MPDSFIARGRGGMADAADLKSAGETRVGSTPTARTLPNQSLTGASQVILGTWNLETYPAPATPRGTAMLDALHSHRADVWFLTELHREFAPVGFHMAYAPPREHAPPHRRKAALSSRFPLDPIRGPDHPAEGRLCLARLMLPGHSETILAASAVAPWRGASPMWRSILGRDLSYAEIFAYLLEYFVSRISEERRPGEAVILGGDFNQGLFGRDYVGTTRGRQALMQVFAAFDLDVPTMHLPALIETHPAIDHIAIPTTWSRPTGARVHRPVHNGRHLSDHALYITDADPLPARVRAHRSG